MPTVKLIYNNNNNKIIYSWEGNFPLALSLEIGETVQIIGEYMGWYKGFYPKYRVVKGIFPSTYVHLKPCKIEKKGLSESVIPVEDPILREVTQVLREWGNILKQLYVMREHYTFKAVIKIMRELLEWRRQLLTGTLTQDQTRELKLKIANKIDGGNR
ncbi:dock-4, putative [Pediculus humanus corporis]|uniref:Dock-4, putative n=1 Tax=Pediculus humanus subsp. corporis TaxID=121224 RepID=E0VNL7_PEDHC|nr:dock-4, putative [Pediculus humanus corporis]EEB14973.1 dock-4, putative [Pediculus humanus corporis]